MTFYLKLELREETVFLLPRQLHTFNQKRGRPIPGGTHKNGTGDLSVRYLHCHASFNQTICLDYQGHFLFLHLIP